jgi:thioredoxin reductase (NADPH)
VIGGGSGGLSCAKNAALLGAKVALCDFVQPSPIGTKWGLGGTCVNVGCIPKKLMHQAALLREGLSDARSYGWEVPEAPPHRWEAMVEGVQMHIKSINFGYRSELMTEGVKYLNAYAVFKDPHTVECTDKKGAKTQVTAARFVIATGGRPRYPDIPGGREHVISSDDLFSLPTPPGHTLCIGASYISLECAGFILGLGMRATVMMRSIPLRGFDQQMAAQVTKYMGEHACEFIEKAVPTSVEPLPSGKKKVCYQLADGSTGSAEYDTVLVAIGRDAETAKIGLANAGVKVHPKSGKIEASGEQTNVPHIYAIGDILEGRPELTPVAIQAGKLLARRLFSDSRKHMDYEGVATTVFTPLEYGCIGLSEEDAIARFGEVCARRPRRAHGSVRSAAPGPAMRPARALPPRQAERPSERASDRAYRTPCPPLQPNIEVYHSYFKPLEWTLPHRGDNACYAKLITHTLDSERIVGFHVCGPNAGEVTQGFAVAIKCGATKEDFDETVGIHPTTAEEFTTLKVTKSSGASAEKAGC